MNWLDKTIEYISPSWAAKRQAYRSVAGLQASYQGAFPTRVATPWSQSESISGLPHLNLPVHRAMRDRARSLTENNPLASAILNTAARNIIGNGLQLQVTTSDPEWNAKAEKLMNDWFPFADFEGRSWVEHQKLLTLSLLRDGDVGGALLTKGQVQLVEGDYISSPYTTSNAFLHDGIELDQYGKVKQYWVMTYVDLKNRDWRQIAPKNFLFVANMRRVTQQRGETFFAQSFNLFDQLQGYLDAVVLAQKIAACLAVFIVSNDPAAGMAGLSTAKNSNGESQPSMALEPGMVQRLKTGEDVKQINPSQPGTGFSENVRMLVRILGLSFGLPLEYVLLDFSTVSGNTAKASAQQAQKAFESIQRLLIDEYFVPLYRWRISKFINDNELEDRDDKFSHQWHAEPWPYIDPVKEVQAQLLMVDAGLTTETRLLRSQGIDAAKLREERAAELADKRAKNIPIYHTSIVQEQGQKGSGGGLSNENEQETPPNNVGGESE